MVFALATLPVELGASRRALELLSTRRSSPTRRRSARCAPVLKAAAFTYIAGLARQIGFFGALILIAEAMDRAT